MTRSQWRPVLGVGLAAAILAHVGCGRTFQTADPATSKATAPPPASAGPGEAAAPANGKLFADWKGVKAAIAVTGQMNGYLDPCGCTEGQLGGLGRRYDLFEKMKAQGIPAARIDLGGLTRDPANARGGMVQAKEKFNRAIEAMEMMRYDAIALAPEDLKFGVFETLGVLLNQKDKFPVVSANLAPAAALAGAFDRVIRPSVVAEAGPFKVGVTAVVDPKWYADLKDPSLDLLEVKPPDAVLPEVLKDLEGKSAFQVLLVQGPPELARELGAKFRGFDLVVATSDVPDPDGRPEPIAGGDNSMIQVGQQGKYVGVVGLFGGEAGKAPTIRYQKVPLNGARYKNAEPMRALIDEAMQRTLKDLRVVEDFPRMANASAPAGATYAGADACKECHPNAYHKWGSTKHAHAFDTLIHNPKDPKRVREFDAECVSCHTTGFGYRTGWVSAEKTPQLMGNQCENCHGPASKHAEDPTNRAFLDPLHLTAQAADRGGLCLKCHDAENSVHFNFEKYYPQIQHKGLDDLKDPKVRRGKAPAQDRAGE